MTSSTCPVILSDKPVVAQGNRQFVYDHPLDPASLIKLPKPETYDAAGNLRDRRRGDRFRRATAFRDFLREFQEYLELKARHPGPDEVLPLCAVRGVVQTDIGLGLVYERIAEPDGSLSPTLLELLRARRIGAQHIAAAEAFFDLLAAEHVVIGNRNMNNLVYQGRGDEPGRFVWIDSFGSKEFVPFRRWSRRRNARKIAGIRALCLDRMAGAMASAAPV